jgi:hypothetical protein
LRRRPGENPDIGLFEAKMPVQNADKVLTKSRQRNFFSKTTSLGQHWGENFATHVILGKFWPLGLCKS